MAAFNAQRLFQTKLLMNCGKRLLTYKCPYERFTGKTVIVTGSTKGIGLACVRRFAEEGAKVVMSSRSAENVDTAMKELQEEGLSENVVGMVCDASSKEDRLKMIDKAISLNKDGVVHYFVSNVGNGSFRTLMDIKESSYEKIMNLNLKSHFQLSQELLPHMKKQKGGSMVFVSSIATYAIHPPTGAYSVSKMCLVNLTKLLASELGAFNIRANCVIVGMTETEMSAPTLSNKELADKWLLPNCLLRRIAQPHEISGPITFLCSDDASYVNGETMVISGGLTHTRI